LTKRSNTDNVTGSLAFSFLLIKSSNNSSKIDNYNCNNLNNQIIHLQHDQNSSASTKELSDAENESNKTKENCNYLEKCELVFANLNGDKNSNLKAKESFYSVNNMSIHSSPSSASCKPNNCNHRSLPNFQIKSESNDQFRCVYQNTNDTSNANDKKLFSPSVVTSSNSSSSTSSDETTTNEETETINQVMQKEEHFSSKINLTSNLSPSSDAISIPLSNLLTTDVKHSSQMVSVSNISNSFKNINKKQNSTYGILNDKINLKKSKSIEFELKNRSIILEQKISVKKANLIENKKNKSETDGLNVQSVGNLYLTFLNFRQLRRHKKKIPNRSKSLNSYLQKKGIFYSYF
jgi:hypothetical protein